jgi:ankyrin repeat protein
LDHKADVNLVDQWNRTVLVNAAADNGDPDSLKRLVDAGADLNWQDCHKRTSLGYAAKRGVVRAVDFFLSSGADPHIPDHWGYTPLCEAIHENHHQVLWRLLQVNDIITTAKTVDGRSILHLAAIHGDIETLRALRYGNLEVLDSSECDDEGLTAQDLFRLREGTEPVLQESFQALLNSIVHSKKAWEESDSSGSESEGDFTDAIEYQIDEEIDQTLAS